MTILRHVRARILGGLPQPLRSGLRWGRGQLQRVDGRVRARLPERWGGPFESVEQRVLHVADQAAARALLLHHSPEAALETEEELAARLLPSDRLFCVGCFIAGELVAIGWCVGVGPSDERPFEHALLASDFVKPTLRRRGLARKLHAARLREASTRGGQRAFAWVARQNPASIAGFERSGFERMAVEDRPAGLSPVSPDHLLLTRTLEKGP